MAVNLSPYGGVGAQFLDNAGNVLTGGKIETYAAGTTVPQATYTSSVGVTFHPNPIILDASGRVPSGGEIWLTDGLAYKFVLKDSNNVLIATYDNITGINSNFVNFVNQQEIQTATAGQTVFTLTTTQYQPGTNSLSVFVDGVNQYGPGALYAYFETNSTTVTFVNGLHVGAEVKFTTSQLNSSGATAASQVAFTGFKGQTGVVQDLADDDGSDWIGFEQAGAGAIAISAQDKMRQIVSVKDFGAVGDGITNDTVVIANAIAATPAYGTLYFPPGVYCANIFIWRSNISLIGAGAASTIIKLPNSAPNVTVPAESGGTVTGLPNVIEIGEAAMGNLADPYTNVVIQGLSVDGNKANNPDVTLDVFGHGIIVTNTSYCKIIDVNVRNAWVSGVILAINSNYAFVKAYSYNCGFSVAQPWYGFDVNSSKYGIFDIITDACNYGARILDNCYNNHLRVTCYDTSKTAFVYNNQIVNASYSNNIEGNIYNGCALGGAVIGNNCFNSTIKLNIKGITNVGLQSVPSAAAYSSTGNNITLTTNGCARNSLTTNQYDSFNIYTVNSIGDCTSGAVGSFHALDIGGSNSIISTNIKGLTVPNGRGFVFRATATKNILANFIMDAATLVTTLEDQGTDNFKNFGIGYVSSASAATLPLPINGSAIRVTGTTTIASLASPIAYVGRQVTLIFDSSLTVVTGSGNIRLAGAVNFSATATDTLTLVSNGTNWVEVSRSVN